MVRTVYPGAPRALRGQYRQYVDAGLIAAPASVRADAAMFVVVCVPLALVRAGATHLGACLHDRSREVRLEFGLPAEDLARGGAQIGAVQTQADTANHHAYVVLGEVSVDVRGAALRAVEARVDALEQRTGLDRGSPRVRLQHLLSVGHEYLPFLQILPTLSRRPSRVKPPASRSSRREPVTIKEALNLARTLQTAAG